MENFPFNSYPDSVNSSPRSRDVDCETASLDEPNPGSSYKVKFMCSYGGKILPRPHDNQLTYVGGDTKIIAVDRNVRFSSLLQKLNSISDTDVCFKYQLPGEDLDALISVTNDEDLEHMMLEYDRLFRASMKPARLRLFLFPVSAAASFGTNDTKSERQWFVDALNSAQIRNLEDSSPPSAAVENPDFLFGFDKSGQLPAPKLQDPAPAPAPKVSDGIAKDVTGGSDYGSEDRYVIGDPVVSPAAIHRHMQELQIMQNANQEQAMRRNEEINQSRAYYGEFYPQKAPPPQPMPVQQQYWQEPQITTGGYGAPPSINAEQPMYLISTPGGVYQAPAPTGQAAQPYYTMQRPIYNTVAAAAAPPPSIQQANIGGYTEGIGIMRPPVGAAVNQQGYAHVSYDGAGRQQVYYTTTAPPYQAAGELRQGGSPMHQEGKIVNQMPPQTTPM